MQSYFEISQNLIYIFNYFCSDLSISHRSHMIERSTYGSLDKFKLKNQQTSHGLNFILAQLPKQQQKRKASKELHKRNNKNKEVTIYYHTKIVSWILFIYCYLCLSSFWIISIFLYSLLSIQILTFIRALSTSKLFSRNISSGWTNQWKKMTEHDQTYSVLRQMNYWWDWGDIWILQNQGSDDDKVDLSKFVQSLDGSRT
jgi:hypothetical protein